MALVVIQRLATIFLNNVKEQQQCITILSSLHNIVASIDSIYVHFHSTHGMLAEIKEEQEDDNYEN